MPTNRTKMKRIPQNSNMNVESWLRWHCTIAQFIDPRVTGGSPWTDATSNEFWEKNKAAILEAFDQKARQKNQPFTRPQKFWDELEEKHPRRKKGVHKWFGPIQADGSDREMTEEIYESDRAYLKRLGLLYDWEV